MADDAAATAEMEHHRLDQLHSQTSALSSACDELLSDTSQRGHELQALSMVRDVFSSAGGGGFLCGLPVCVET